MNITKNGTECQVKKTKIWGAFLSLPRKDLLAKYGHRAKIDLKEAKLLVAEKEG